MKRRSLSVLAAFTHIRSFHPYPVSGEEGMGWHRVVCFGWLGLLNFELSPKKSLEETEIPGGRVGENTVSLCLFVCLCLSVSLSVCLSVCSIEQRLAIT